MSTRLQEKVYFREEKIEQKQEQMKKKLAKALLCDTPVVVTQPQKIEKKKSLCLEEISYFQAISCELLKDDLKPFNNQ